MGKLIHLIGLVRAEKTHFHQMFFPLTPRFDIQAVYHKYGCLPADLQNAATYNQFCGAVEFSLAGFRRQYLHEDLILIDGIMQTSRGETANLCESSLGTDMRDLSYLLSLYDIVEMIDLPKFSSSAWTKSEVFKSLMFSRKNIQSEIKDLQIYSNIEMLTAMKNKYPFVKLNGLKYKTEEQKQIRNSIIYEWYIRKPMTVKNIKEITFEEKKVLLSDCDSYINEQIKMGMKELEIPLEIATSDYFIDTHLDETLDTYVYLVKKDLSHNNYLQIIMDYRDLKDSSEDLISILHYSLNKEKLVTRMDQYGFILQAFMIGGTIAETRRGRVDEGLSNERFSSSLNEYLNTKGSKRDYYKAFHDIIYGITRLMDSGLVLRDPDTNEIPILNDSFNTEHLSFIVDGKNTLRSWLYMKTLDPENKKDNWRYVAEDYYQTWKGGDNPIAKAQQQVIQQYFLCGKDVISGFQSLSNIQDEVKSKLKNMAKGIATLGSLLDIGISKKVGSSGITFTSPLKEFRQSKSVGKWMNKFAQLLEKENLFEEKVLISGRSEYQRIRNLYSTKSVQERGFLNLREILHFETIIQYFLNTKFDGKVENLNTFLQYAYSNYYETNFITQHEAIYSTFSDFVHTLKVPTNAKSFYVTIHGEDILVEKTSNFEREIILELADSGILNKIIPPNIFGKFVSMHKNNEKFSLIVRLTDSIDGQKSVADFALLLPGGATQPIGHIIFAECLGFAEKTRPYFNEENGKMETRIYGPDKDISCLRRGFDSKYGEAIIYISYSDAIHPYYENTIKDGDGFSNPNGIKNIGRIAPLLMRQQFSTLLRIWKAHFSTHHTLETILSDLGSFENEIDITFARSIQHAFGLKYHENAKYTLDLNGHFKSEDIYSVNPINPAQDDSTKLNFLQWWKHYWTSTNTDTYSLAKYYHLLSLMSKKI